jgi:hypothetical protein
LSAVAIGRLDLKAFAGPLLADDDAIWQVHAAFLRIILVGCDPQLAAPIDI